MHISTSSNTLDNIHTLPGDRNRSYDVKHATISHIMRLLLSYILWSKDKRTTNRNSQARSPDIEPFENALSHGTAANLPSIVVNSIIYGSRENMRPPVRPLASDKNDGSDRYRLSFQFAGCNRQKAHTSSSSRVSIKRIKSPELRVRSAGIRLGKSDFPACWNSGLQMIKGHGYLALGSLGWNQQQKHAPWAHLSSEKFRLVGMKHIHVSCRCSSGTVIAIGGRLPGHKTNLLSMMITSTPIDVLPLLGIGGPRSKTFCLTYRATQRCYVQFNAPGPYGIANGIKTFDLFDVKRFRHS
ncbi:uncharacterized protein H6S33_007480 [Morchella sextelata]|uniref:uncharacterized protein n=1 Tax=Morchella sextelata TaxID=1174677 RepID=UPI001D04B9BF|nr:uncharacterized protein H6S33_007480 [Morchella sextelata]KAH0603821.1 hypothetical protein H6S33_007480 [Morchella sextelata]